MASATIRTINELKESLSKELNKDDSSSERCNDIIDQLDAVQDMSLAVLSETLVGTVVSKFKAHSDADVAAKAKGLVKKWKQLAKQAGAGSATKAKAKPVAARKPAPSNAPAVAASSSSAEGSAEWNQLPPLRKNTANKLHQTFELSIASLTRSDIHIDAIKSLNISRATEVEAACHEYSKGIKQNYLEKIRSLIFNLKKNSDLRENVILGSTQPETLVTLGPEQLATAETNKA